MLDESHLIAARRASRIGRRGQEESSHSPSGEITRHHDRQEDELLRVDSEHHRQD